jgi:hypothetical protein
MRPFVRVAPTKEGDYLLAGLFLVEGKKPPAPDDLWTQFENRADIVYYNWELTGIRLHQCRLFCQLFSLLPPVSGRGGPAVATKNSPPPFVPVENWLAGLEMALGNTVTEVTRTAPDELTITRSAPLVFTGLELVWLSYWLADAPAAPLNLNLMPRAKISGPGFPSQ